jgi:hypothetical protein
VIHLPFTKSVSGNWWQALNEDKLRLGMNTLRLRTKLSFTFLSRIINFLLSTISPNRRLYLTCLVNTNAVQCIILKFCVAVYLRKVLAYNFCWDIRLENLSQRLDHKKPYLSFRFMTVNNAEFKAGIPDINFACKWCMRHVMCVHNFKYGENVNRWQVEIPRTLYWSKLAFKKRKHI